jgi:hypothetical protein
MQCSCNNDAGNGTTVEQANKCVLTWHKQCCRRAVAVSWSPLKRMYYPQFRERLLRIAAEEQAHVTSLYPARSSAVATRAPSRGHM